MAARYLSPGRQPPRRQTTGCAVQQVVPAAGSIACRLAIPDAPADGVLQPERIFGLWKVVNAGALASNVVWSDSTGSVLIGAIPNHGDGELGIISGNQFTPFALPPNTQASFGGTW